MTIVVVIIITSLVWVELDLGKLGKQEGGGKKKMKEWLGFFYSEYLVYYTKKTGPVFLHPIYPKKVN